MIVNVKDVGPYKIYVEEYYEPKWLPRIVFIYAFFVGAFIFLYKIQSCNSHACIVQWIEFLIGWVIMAFLFILSIYAIGCRIKFLSDPAYYVYTTTCGTYCEVIRKTTPEQDHIAICKASHEFEMQILERIKKEEELKEIVGVCR